VLRDGAEAQHARRERFASGRPTVDDLNPPPAV
jgi:hypothetical protein